jgi:hypothetical protein
MKSGFYLNQYESWDCSHDDWYYVSDTNQVYKLDESRYDTKIIYQAKILPSTAILSKEPPYSFFKKEYIDRIQSNLERFQSPTTGVLEYV